MCSLLETTQLGQFQSDYKGNVSKGHLNRIPKNSLVGENLLDGQEEFDDYHEELWRTRGNQQFWMSTYNFIRMVSQENPGWDLKSCIDGCDVVFDGLKNLGTVLQNMHFYWKNPKKKRPATGPTQYRACKFKGVTFITQGYKDYVPPFKQYEDPEYAGYRAEHLKLGKDRNDNIELDSQIRIAINGSYKYLDEIINVFSTYEIDKIDEDGKRVEIRTTRSKFYESKWKGPKSLNLYLGSRLRGSERVNVIEYDQNTFIVEKDTEVDVEELGNWDKWDWDFDQILEWIHKFLMKIHREVKEDNFVYQCSLSENGTIDVSKKSEGIDNLLPNDFLNYFSYLQAPSYYDRLREETVFQFFPTR